MSDPAVLATAISILSLVLAAAAVVWSVASWRREGPLLRVHAHLYGTVLTVQIFNAGRTPEQIQRVVLGGVRHGHSGVDITDALGGETVLEASGAIRKEVDWLDIASTADRRLLRNGWSSLWILSGSMREYRADVLPTGDAYPPTAGWRLAGKGAQQTRYVPLVLAAPFSALLWDASSHTAAIGGLLAVVVLVLVYRLHRAVTRRMGPFGRERLQNAAAVIGGLVSLTSWLVRTSPGALPILGYLALACVVAIPTAVTGVAVETRDVMEQARLLRRRLRPSATGPAR
ncbi:MAG TPA: hypothetical protein VGK17_17185 [Propionicimonas sp.]|jgi:uncharacterized membrane protein